MIHLTKFQDETSRLQKKVLKIIHDIEPSYEAKIANLFTTQDAILKLALIGQYNAGKSSILKALTGDESIKIDSNICTDEVTAYDWNHIKIIDTPGVHAGRLDHDQTTYTAIDDADLLIFVITNELFDDVIGEHFRQLAFERHKAKEILLVVNKMARDNGTKDTKISSMLSVIEPMLPEDFGTTFIDAECYIEAFYEEDEDDRNDLSEESNFTQFIEAINKFIEQKGLLGRLTTPLSVMQTTVRNLREERSVTSPEEKMLVEVLHRKLYILKEGEFRLKNTMTEMMNNTLYEVTGCGDDLAEIIGENCKKEDIEKKSNEVEKHCKDIINKLSEKFVEVVRSHTEQITAELDQLEKSRLSKALYDAIEQLSSTSTTEMNIDGQLNTSDYDGDIQERYTKLSGWAQKGLNFTNTSAKGVNATASNLGTATATAGSDLHSGVKIVGKFLGVKFKPWQAVNIAKNIGNVARYIGPIMSIIGIGIQIYDDIKQEKVRTTMRNARADIRREFRRISKKLESQFLEGISSTVAGIHMKEIQKKQSILDDISRKNLQTNGFLSDLSKLEKELGLLIVNIQDTSSVMKKNIDRTIKQTCVV